MLNRTVLLHILFWSLDTSFQVYSYFNLSFENGESMTLQLIQILMSSALRISFFYINYSYLERILAKKKLRITFFYCILSTISFTLIYTAQIQFHIMIFYSYHYFGFVPCIMYAWSTALFILTTSSAFYFVTKWNITEKMKRALEQNKYEAQQDVQRKQFEPAFISHSLDELYEQSLATSSDISEHIISLASSYRYLLDSRDAIPLDTELDEIECLSSIITTANTQCTLSFTRREFGAITIPKGSLFIPFAIFYSHLAAKSIHSLTLSLDQEESDLAYSISIVTDPNTTDFQTLFNIHGIDSLYKNFSYTYTSTEHTWTGTISGHNT